MHYWRREASKNLWRLCSLEMRFFFIFFFTIIIFSFCFQGHRPHHVHSFLPYLHLSASGHLHRLLCHDSSVSFWLKLLSWGHAAQLNLTCKDWSLNWPRAVSVTVCFLNSSVLSFLSSSGNAVYKVTAVDDKCTYVDHTCNPKVSAYVTVFCCTAFDSRLESWTKHFKSTVVQYYFLFSSVSDLQSDQRHQSVSRLSVHVRLLWRREYIPPLHPGTSSLQPVCVPLVGQLHHRPGAVHPGWGLRVLLLGPEEAWRHPALSTLLLVQQGHTVFHFYTPKTRDVRWCQTTDVM